MGCKISLSEYLYSVDASLADLAGEAFFCASPLQLGLASVTGISLSD